MLGEPNSGWSHFQLGEFHGDVSYLRDVPFYVLEELIRHFEYGGTCAITFDEEGSEFILVIDYVHSFVISSKDEDRVYRIWIKDDDLAKEVISDIETYIDIWADWLCYNPEIDVKRRKQQLLNLITKLKELLKSK